MLIKKPKMCCVTCFSLGVGPYFNNLQYFFKNLINPCSSFYSWWVLSPYLTLCVWCVWCRCCLSYLCNKCNRCNMYNLWWLVFLILLLVQENGWTPLKDDIHHFKLAFPRLSLHLEMPMHSFPTKVMPLFFL